MSDPIDTLLDNGPFAEDVAVQDLGRLDENTLRELKRQIVLQQLDVEDDLISLDEAQNVRIDDLEAQWGEYLGLVQEKIQAQEAKLQRMKDFLKEKQAEKAADLKALKAEHKQARNVLVAAENHLKSSLSAIVGAIKALASIKARDDLSQYSFAQDTWLEDDEG
jgi:hypothetical protein